MKNGTLFIAPLGARDKRDAIFDGIVAHCPGNDFSPVLYLGPNNFILSAAKRQFFSYLKRSRNAPAYIPFQTYTIKQLALQLHDAGQSGTVISDRIRTLLLCELLGEKNIGYARLLSDLYSKMRHYIPSKEFPQLREEIRHLIFEEKTLSRAVQAIDILQSYEDQLKTKGLIDAEEVLRIVRKGSGSRVQESNIPLLDKGGQGGVLSALYRPHTIVIDGFYDPTPLELEILQMLIDSSENAIMIAEEETELLKHFQTHNDGLKLNKLKRSVLRETTGYFSYPSMEDEVEGIARNIKKVILEGTRPWEITVSFPSLSQYLPMLRRIFRRYGIPVSIGEYDLSATKPFTAIERLLSCIEEDYPRNDFLSFITSPCFTSIPPVIKEWAVAYSYRAGIIKGSQSWLSIGDIILNSPDKDMSDEDKKRLIEFQREIRRVIDVLENIRKPDGMTALLDSFEAALNTLGFFEALQDQPEISRAITNIFSEFRQFAGLCKTGDQHIDYLKYLLQEITIADKNESGVKILPFEIAGGLESKALFFGGVLEETLPSRPALDPILPEKVKKELGLPYLEYYLQRQKRYFMRLLHVPSMDPFISYPSADGDKVFLPSPFLDWEQVVCPVQPNIFTEEEVLVSEGMQMPGPNNLRMGKTLFDKKSFGILRQRIGAMSTGYFRVTDIDSYRKCPLRFYIEKVLSLEMETPPKFEVEARLWGTLAHKTMEHLFKGKDFALDELETRLFQSLGESLKKLPIGDFWSGVATEIFKTLVPVIQEREAEIRGEGFEPYQVEQTIKAEIDGIRLKGKVDRADRRREGMEAERQGVKEVGSEGGTGGGNIPTLKKGGEGGFLDNSVILLDYKTGSIDADSLQLPLYARIWQENFAEAVVKAGYYSLKDGKITWYPKKITMEEFINGAVDKTKGLVERMRKGAFPAEPSQPTECRYCYHKPLCEGKS